MGAKGAIGSRGDIGAEGAEGVEGAEGLGSKVSDGVGEWSGLDGYPHDCYDY